MDEIIIYSPFPNHKARGLPEGVVIDDNRKPACYKYNQNIHAVAEKESMKQFSS